MLAATLAPVAGVAAALLLCSVLILWTGASVVEAYWLLLKGAFGSKFAITETLSRATPLILTGLAAAVTGIAPTISSTRRRPRWRDNRVDRVCQPARAARKAGMLKL